MKNWRQTIIRQFNNSPKLLSLIQAINAWLSPDVNFESFYDNIWNIDTAIGYGLDVWGRIVNIPRTLTLSGVPTFGFGEAGDRVNFGYGPFYEASLGVTMNYELTDSVYRQLILAKAAYNITNGSVPAINSILVNILFPGRGNAYVTDGANGPPYQFFGFGEAGDRANFGYGPFCDFLLTGPANMTLTYVFDFPLEPWEVAIVKCGVLPRPTGVTPFWRYPGGT
ncbi:MAG: DUF2612 domain-containing protein [Elusimicrobia bacterium]|nr:DUF2612 domain-containing protein [Elusimicrobiota bacterium]